MRQEEITKKLETLGKDYFTMKDMKKVFPTDRYLKISIKRMVDAGVLTSIAHGIYILKPEKLDVEKIATQLYYPSYISFESALSKYGVINQGLYGLTLATIRHSKKMVLGGMDCEFSQLKPDLFFGFDLANGTYLAQAEKALLDEVYLMSLGKRKVNTSEWDMDNLNKDKLKKYLAFYPVTVRNLVTNLCLL
jgi:predicted transcriptional regulator of viral defense system